MTRKGRSTTGGPAVPYYDESPLREAAKYLRLTVHRFLNSNANLNEVREAIKIFEDALSK